MVVNKLTTSRSTDARVLVRNRLAAKRLFNIVFYGFFSFALLIQPVLGISIWRFDRVHAQDNSTEPINDYISPEDTVDGNPIDSLGELDAIFLDQPALTLSAQDVNAIRNNRVDVRVTDYLIYLVTPVDQGGAGFTHIKAQRILKNYDTTGTGRIDRETLAAIEENNSIVSAHNDGQAVDISEVGSITCKMVERRHLGGSTTHWQDPKPIKVAWQSRDGINRNPTPKGASFFEISSNMTAQSILMMLNESGELDDLSDYVRGLTIGEILQYVGANVLLKNYGTGEILVDPRSGDFANLLGALLLQKAMPNLPYGLPIADGNEDVRVAVARAHLEDLLNLPPGSLRGAGWNQVLESAGQRTLENALGLPALTFENQSLSEVLKNKAVQAALKEFSDKDDVFGLINGTVTLLQAEDDRAFVYAGVDILANALRLSDANRTRLIEAVKNNTNPNISLETAGTDQNVEVDVLRAIFENTGTQDKLKQFGQKYLNDLLYKAVPNNLLGLTRDVLNNLATSTSTVIYNDLTEKMGLRKIASDSSINPVDASNIKSSNNSRYTNAIAQVLNSSFALSGSDGLTGTDINSLINGGGSDALAKIGGNQADKAIGWDYGTGYQIIKGQKTIGQGLQEIFGNSVAEIVGLPRDVEVSFQGDIYQNYGDALVQSRLGFTLSKDGSAEDINPQTLYAAFGFSETRSLAQLRKDSGFWNKPAIADALEFSDIRLGAPLGTSKAYLIGDINNKGFSKKIAQNNLSAITQDKLLNYLDLEDTFKLKNSEMSFIITTIADWDNTSFENRQKVIDLGKKLMGRTLDQRSIFDKDTILTFAQGKTTEAVVHTLVKEGVRQLSKALGINISSFEPKDIDIMTRLLTAAYNGDLSGTSGAYGYSAEDLILKWLGDATKIPELADLKTFLNGDLRTAIESWSAAQMVEFATKFLPDDVKLTYQEIRSSFILEDKTLINQRAASLAAKNGGSTSDYLDQARKELMQEARDSAKYKISDAFLLQANIPIPENFSKIMFSGSDKDRAQILTQATFAYLDQELAKISSAYEPGTLEKIYNGDLSSIDTDQLILSITGGSGVTIGSFSSGFVLNFYNFIKATDRNSFYTSGRYDQMWTTMENWMGNALGISGLPAGFAKTVYYAADHNWSFNASLKDSKGRVIVNSINGLGRELLASRVTQWADTALNLPVGSAYQIYRATNGVIAASRALAAAKAANDAGQIAQARQGLAGAQAELTALAINIALNSCAACQQFFASVDRVLQAPPGFTNTLVAGAISMALGLGPGGLIAAAAIYLFGVYRVDYLCPLPPPDRFAYPQFDNEYDQLEPATSSYYDDPGKKVKDNPDPGENPFDWDDGLPFKNGNNPELWMAWSRYFTGKLLDATMTYGEQKADGSKPLQVITYRQANAEFFAPRMAKAFGDKEKNNNLIGLGFTQKSTKTTDWVHASFGGPI